MQGESSGNVAPSANSSGSNGAGAAVAPPAQRSTVRPGDQCSCLPPTAYQKMQFRDQCEQIKRDRYISGDSERVFTASCEQNRVLSEVNREKRALVKWKPAKYSRDPVNGITAPYAPRSFQRRVACSDRDQRKATATYECAAPRTPKARCYWCDTVHVKKARSERWSSQE